MPTFEDLSKKYDRFTIAAYEIKVGGNPLSKAIFSISDILVNLSVGDICGACRFTVTGLYKKQTAQMDTSALKKMKLGEVVTVSLGYGSTLTPVFAGFINELSVSTNDNGISATVYAMDVRALMRENTRSVIYKDKTMKDIADSIRKDYGALISSADVTLAPIEKEMRIVQNIDDLSFLLKAAQERGMILYMEMDKLVIEKPGGKECFSLKWGQAHIEVNIVYLNSEITGIGCATDRIEQISAVKKVEQKVNQSNTVQIKRTVPINPYIAEDCGESIVQSIADRTLRESVRGHIVCRGIPEAMVGHRIKVKELPLSSIGLSDSFLILSIEHRINEYDGFTTAMEIGG